MSATASGAGIVLAAIAIVLIWKGKAPRVSAWLVLAASLCLAPVVLSLTGLSALIAGWTIWGDSIAVIAVIVCGIIFWHEAIKSHGLHWVRTPVVAAILGMSLMAMPGAIGQMAHNARDGVVNTVAHVGGNGLG